MKEYRYDWGYDGFFLFRMWGKRARVPISAQLEIQSELFVVDRLNLDYCEREYFACFTRTHTHPSIPHTKVVLEQRLLYEEKRRAIILRFY